MANEQSIKESNCAGFYLWPPIWIGGSEDEIKTAYSVDPNSEIITLTLQCGIKAKVSLKGVFVFDFSNWPDGAITSMKDWLMPVLARMRFMNLLLAFFYSVFFRTKRQTTEKMFIEFGTYAFSRDFDLNPSHFGCDIRQYAVIQENEKWHKIFMPFHTVVAQDVISEAIRLTDAALLNNSNDTATLGELFLHAFQLHDSGKYEASHISSWTITERCLNQIWLSYLADAEQQHPTCSDTSNEKYINSTRRQKLMGRDFTASIISEILSLNGMLPFEQYKLVSDVRQTRNDWLHKLRAIRREDSRKAINLARYMLQHSKVLDVDIPFHVFSAIPLAFIAKT